VNEVPVPTRFMLHIPFLVVSWAEHLRQHQRSTRADRAVVEAVHKYIHGEPVVRHFLYVATKS
jgi:hypothetical protein